MGREIRRVPPNWVHPRKDCSHLRPCNPDGKCYQPLFDQAFRPAMEEWYAGWKAWDDRTHEDYDPEYGEYWNYAGAPPDPEFYRPDWPDGSATWFQVYETVSEGCPVTPPFETPGELVDYLATYGDFWDQSRVREGRQADAKWNRQAAESFVGRGYAPSLMVHRTATSTTILEPRDGA